MERHRWAMLSVLTGLMGWIAGIEAPIKRLENPFNTALGHVSSL